MEIRDETQINYLHTLAKTGNTGLVTEHVDDLLTLTDSELADSFQLKEDQAPQMRVKLNALKDNAKSYQNKYDYVQKKLPNPHNPWMYDLRAIHKNLKQNIKHMLLMNKRCQIFSLLQKTMRE